MKTASLVLCILALESLCCGEELATALPKPHATRRDGDPEWLAYSVQFHGHLGPWATAGTRLGMGGRAAVGARGYFDVRVTCEGPFGQGPPKACFLDGVQVATGATIGKRNLYSAPGEQVVLHIENTRTGRKVEVRPTPKLLELLHSFKPHPKTESTDHDHGDHKHGDHKHGDHKHGDHSHGDHSHGDHDHGDHDHGDHVHGDQTATLESIARRIAVLPDREIFTITPVGR